MKDTTTTTGEQHCSECGNVIRGPYWHVLGPITDPFMTAHGSVLCEACYANAMRPAFMPDLLVVREEVKRLTARVEALHLALSDHLEQS